MKKFRIDRLTLLWIAFIIYVKGSLIIHLFLAIALHELGHFLACIFTRVKIKSMYFSLFGARMELVGHISYLKELIIATCGPLFGIIGFLIAYLFASKSTDVMTFAILSLCLSIFNLFPLNSLDGGRITKCILCSIFPLHISEVVMQIITFFTLFVFWLLSTYIMVKYANGLSAFVFCAIFFSKCFIFQTKNRDLESI